MSSRRISPLATLGVLFAAVLVGVLALPVVALVLSATPATIRAGLSHPGFAPAMWLSLRTTTTSLCVVMLLGTPLAWWLARSSSAWARGVELVIELPVVMPPAVIGVALLQTFGRQGLLGPTLASLHVVLAFSERAVILAQVVVSAPFFVQAAANAFRKVDPELLAVARSLGASPTQAVWRVAAPIALPGLAVGASLAWARAAGEFGATLLFAGSLPGTTQTLPLAIFAALESDVRLAVAFALGLVVAGGICLLALRVLPPLLLLRSLRRTPLQ